MTIMAIFSLNFILEFAWDLNLHRLTTGGFLKAILDVLTRIFFDILPIGLILFNHFYNFRKIKHVEVLNVNMGDDFSFTSKDTSCSCLLTSDRDLKSGENSVDAKAEPSFNQETNDINKSYK